MLLTVVIVLAMHVVLPDAQSAGIFGTRQKCNNEGEEVPAASINIRDIQCFTCMCKNGYVECQKDSCPSLDGCYMVVPGTGCCQKVCKGCLVNGIYHQSGTEWRDPDNPCQIFHCEAGVVTESVEECYTPCHNPTPPAPGHCCGTCPGCRINGQRVMEDRDVTIPEDPCLKCRCYKGQMTCVKHACPVLQCSPNSTFNISGDCCPHCRGERQLMELPRGECMLRRDVHKPSNIFHPDHCTRCHCMNGTSICKRTTCSVLECLPEMQFIPPGQCCPQCSIQESRATCTMNGHTYQDDETWELGPCKSCVCKQGQIRCAMGICPTCPPHFREVREPGECCQRCVEDGVCTVFGDPHYRTFDGKFYSFQGSCKYQLASDCTGRSFSIRVTNDARSTKTSSWTKTVSLKVGELKVNLGQKMRVKVNGKRIELPYELKGKVNINRTEDSVLVNTHIGVSVLWNGNSYVRVSVPPTFKGHTCGLCGNFNSNARDDFMTRRGRLVQDADKFGTSWRVGGKKACTRLEEEPQCQKPLLKRNYRPCEPLKLHPFSTCHEKVPYMAYFRACMVDMCECPSGRCHCESFTAYAHECQRFGVKLRKWKSATGCVSGQRRSLPPRLN